MTDSGFVEITRTFDAPREVVWKAITDPSQIAEWWGPEGYHAPVESIDIDLQEGGRFYLSMVDDASGTASQVSFDITELVENELLLMTSAISRPEFGPAEKGTCRIELSDADGATKLELKAGPYYEEMRKGTQQGWISMFGKLDKLLAAHAAA